MTRSDLRIGGTVFRRMLAFAAVGAATLLGGCVQDGLMDIARFQLKPGDIIIERRPDAEYEKVVPHFVELCAASQFRSTLTGEGGGPAGHAVLYVKGAYKDERTAFPQLRRCRAVATSLEDPEHAAGVSVNAMFKSVNWVAVPGYDLFFQGNLAPGERLTRAEFDAVERLWRSPSPFTASQAPHRIPIFETFWREQVSAPIWRFNSPDRCFVRDCP